MKSEELFERAKKVSPGGVHSPVRGFSSIGRPPVFFNKAEGAYVTSVEGQKYIDFCQSFGPNILGHRDPDVQEEVQMAVSDAWTFGAAEPYSLKFAELILKHLPFVDMLRFVNSGTEAVMSALRLARAVTKRDKVIKFEGCYHGHVDSMLVKAGSGLAGASASSSAGVSEKTAADTLVVPLNDLAAFEKVLNENANDVAAVILEPLPANYGLLIQNEDFIQKVCQLTKENCSLVIFDEVISGFRVHMGGMAAKLGIDPDIVTYGKIIGGGFPVGCYAAKEKFMSMIAPLGPVYQAGTLSANPIAMRAGLATIKKCIEHNVHEVLERRCQNFVSELNKKFQSHAKPWKAVSYGSLFWIASDQVDHYYRPDQISSDHTRNFKPLFLGLLNEGVYLAPNAYEVGFLSFAHTEEVIRETLSKFDKVLGELA